MPEGKFRCNGFVSKSGERRKAIKISRKTDYAVRVLIALARDNEDTISARELSENMDIPYRFLEQVIRSLRQYGFVKSYRGFKGGYRLARSAREIRLLEVVEKLHGPIELVPCLEEKPDCKLTDGCGAHKLWSAVDISLKKTLHGVTIDKLVANGSKPKALKALAAKA